jgi:hypothetical protein
VACDFYISDIENSDSITGGFENSNLSIRNIDHHAPVKEMFEFVSSGNLAIQHVTEFGVTPLNTHVVINHTDCDSVISSLIVRGLLPPHRAFAEAVIAADHTGAPNAIADLLQALDSERDLNLAARNLGLLLSNKPLEPLAQSLVEERQLGRTLTREVVAQGLVEHYGAVALVPYQEGLRNEFLPDLLPDSAIILMADEPHVFNGKTSESTTTARLRLGLAAPEGLTIFDLKVPEFVDSAYGGRWNAGSNRRGGGSTISAQEYARRVQEQYETALGT